MNADANETLFPACDCHVHVIGAASDYPMLPDRAYTPPAATVAELNGHLARLNLRRAVLIQPSFYGTDNRCMMAALRELGDAARGVAVIGDDTDDGALEALAAGGVRGVRVNLESIGVDDPAAARDALRALAARVAPLGWHIQVYAASHVVAALAGLIADLGVPIVLDHFAMLTAGGGIGHRDVDAILPLVRDGHAYIKLSAPYRVSAAAPRYADVAPIARAFIGANPARVLWASDWPHTNRTPGARPVDVSPFRPIDDAAVLDEARAWCASDDLRNKLFVENPARLYGF
ncbi:amidohydrolase [Burkholderia sp. WAC0059]|nr:amidohydrolase [Burkholderia sp. WAC0059]